MVNASYEVDQYAKMEKYARLKEDASINTQLHDLRKGLKILQKKMVDVSAVTYQHGRLPTSHTKPTYALRPPPNLEDRNARAYSLIAKSYAQLFERLRIAIVLQPVKEKLPDLITRNFDGNK
ncbi:hypothetical protein H5410_050847 [Solanum commersonii]|uniref:Uncharacterized protein n=1 Tax=Solanum commersonii TaxID=4109 RepID=A0A9J5WYT3_SOLCO|nr:hypothetical protein H5410_050847 [Solanum commersonii]